MTSRRNLKPRSAYRYKCLPTSINRTNIIAGNKSSLLRIAKNDEVI